MTAKFGGSHWGSNVAGVAVGMVLAASLSGCQRNTGDGGVAGSDGTTVSQEKLNRVKKEVGEAVDAAKDYAQFKGDELAKKFKSEMAVMSQNIDDLTSKANTLSGDARSKIETTVAELRKQQEVLSRSVDSMTSASGEALRDMGQGADATLQRIREGYDNARKLVPGQQ